MLKAGIFNTLLVNHDLHIEQRLVIAGEDIFI